MGMNVCRLGDQSTGHKKCFPPKPNKEASQDVFVNGRGVHRQGDMWFLHCCPNETPECHDSFLAQGSSTVFVNGKGVGRVGDILSCTDIVMTGSDDVLAG